jgi:type IV secretory pathway VirB10-like protein
VFILISISFASIGFYAIGTGESPWAGIGLVAAGLFAGLLSVKVTSLQEQLDWERQQAKRLSDVKPKKQTKAKKNPPKETKVSVAPSPEAEQPSYPEPTPPELEPEPEESYWVEPDGTPSKPLPRVEPIASQKIVTRTSQVAGGQTQETWKGERTWSSFEVEELVGFYLDGELLDSIAIKLRMDKKDVIYKLTRLNFDETGDLDVTSEAPNDGRAWSDEHSKKLLEMNEAGITLSGMASILGRTKLAIGWRLAEKRKLLNVLNGRRY